MWQLYLLVSMGNVVRNQKQTNFPFKQTWPVCFRHVFPFESLSPLMVLHTFPSLRANSLLLEQFFPTALQWEPPWFPDLEILPPWPQLLQGCPSLCNGPAGKPWLLHCHHCSWGQNHPGSRSLEQRKSGFTVCDLLPFYVLSSRTHWCPFFPPSNLCGISSCLPPQARRRIVPDIWRKPLVSLQLTQLWGSLQHSCWFRNEHHPS